MMAIGHRFAIVATIPTVTTIVPPRLISLAGMAVINGHSAVLIDSRNDPHIVSLITVGRKYERSLNVCRACLVHNNLNTIYGITESRPCSGHLVEGGDGRLCNGISNRW